jgi:hypothetical protein
MGNVKRSNRVSRPPKHGQSPDPPDDARKASKLAARQRQSTQSTSIPLSQHGQQNFPGQQPFLPSGSASGMASGTGTPASEGNPGGDLPVGVGLNSFGGQQQRLPVGVGLGSYGGTGGLPFGQPRPGPLGWGMG